MIEIEINIVQFTTSKNKILRYKSVKIHTDSIC